MTWRTSFDYTIFRLFVRATRRTSAICIGQIGTMIGSRVILDDGESPQTVHRQTSNWKG